QDRLRKERDRAQMYLDVAGVIILVLDASATVTLINRMGCKILGGDEKDILGTNWIDTFIPERLKDEIMTIFERVVSGEVEPGGYYENPVLTCSGEERLIAWTNSMIRDDSGAIIATLSSGDDVTEKRRAEEERLNLHAQLQQSQKLEAIGTLAGGVAHEINNPVNITMNFARLIKNRCEEGSQIEEFAQEIIDEGERMSSIVKKLLSFARQEKERHSSARIVDIVNSTVALMKMVMRKDQIALEVDVPEDLPEILCRSQQIQQVLMNLLTNARDALNDRYPSADPEKVIRISARLMDRDGEPWVRTTVEDRGIGIKPGALEKVFDPFFTTKSRDQGTGLGLSVSYGIVKEHRGDLWVESEPGACTRFHMDLRVNNGWQLSAGEEGD
ncbi:MAG: PAS domain S-box protein, partial [Deltaproteobacteria bacterium]|nr:PAS domain S-box protein [Deltaproteobacteria bacterium]